MLWTGRTACPGFLSLTLTTALKIYTSCSTPKSCNSSHPWDSSLTSCNETLSVKLRARDLTALVRSSLSEGACAGCVFFEPFHSMALDDTLHAVQATLHLLMFCARTLAGTARRRALKLGPYDSRMKES